MSWEEDRRVSIPCPCGKGLITRIDYSDDWGRYDEKVRIECPECQKRYQLVSESWYKDRGDYGTIYYLQDSENTPVYKGTIAMHSFPRVVSISQMPFDEYLICSYTFEQLKTALTELCSVSAVSNLSGIAKIIAKEHRDAFQSVKISVLREYVKSACNKYSSCDDNKEKRLLAEQKEKEERAAFRAEKYSHMMKIPL